MTGSSDGGSPERALSQRRMPQLPHVALAAPLVIALCACSSDESAPVGEPGREVTETAGRAAPPVDLEPVPAKETRSDLGADALSGPVDPFAGIERPPIELTREDPLTGRIRPDAAIPAGESAEVVVEVLMPGSPSIPGGVFDADSARIEWMAWREATRAPVRQDLTFEAHRPIGADHLRIRVEGDHLFGAGAAWTPGTEDLPRSPVEVPARVGARVLVRFDLPEDATVAEAAALVGRELGVTEGPSWFRGGSGARRRFPFQLDEDVSGTVRGLPPGDWRIDRASILGPREQEGQRSLAPFCVRPGFTFDVEAGATAEITVPTIRGRRLACRVVDAAGRPVVGATARIVNRDSSGRMSGTRSTHCRTDDDGRFVAPALIDVPDSIIVEAEGFPSRRLWRDDAAALLDTEDATIVLGAGAALRLRVTSSEGLAAKGVQVTVTPDRAEDDPLVVWTDENGEATFHPLPSGGARISAAALEGPGPRDESTSVEGVARFHPPSIAATDASAGPLWCLDEQLLEADIQAGEITLRLVPAPEVTGHIHGIAQDWPDPVLVLVRPASSGGMSWFDGARPMSNVGLRVDRETSSFSGQVAPGTYEAVATAGRGEGASIRLTDARLEASGVVAFTAVDAPVELELGFESPAPIVGRIQEPDGTPVPGTEVTLRDRDVRRDRHAATSDDLGAFAHPPLRPGRYSAYVADQRFVMAGRVEFTVPADRPTPEVVVVVSRAGAARITVIAPDGLPRERPLVDIHRVGGGRAPVGVADEDSPWPGAHAPLEPGRYVAAAHSARSVQTGEFDFAPGPAGTPAPRTPDLLHTAEFEVVAGEVTEVVVREREEPVAVITGRVEVGGAPSPGETVWLARDDAMLARAVTDDAGRFTIPTGFTGPASLWVHGVREQAAARLELEITDGPNPVGAIDLPTGRVIGRMPADLRPAAGAIALPAAFAPGSDTPRRYSGGVTDERFVIEHLPDGDHVIGLPIEGGGVDRAVTVRIENGATVRGVVLGSSER